MLMISEVLNSISTACLIVSKESLGITPWIVWAVIGIIGGYMAARLLRPDLSAALFLIVGIAGSLLGGWGYTWIFGSTDEDIYISLLTSAVICGLFLWVLSNIISKSSTENDDNE